MVVNVDNVEKCMEYSSLPFDENSERYLIAYNSLHATDEPNAWVIDSRCSNHMTSDRRKLINLKK